MAKKILLLPFDLLAHHTRTLTAALEQFPHAEFFVPVTETYSFIYDQHNVTQLPFAGFDGQKALKQLSDMRFAWLKEDLPQVLAAQISLVNSIKPDVIISDTMPSARIVAEKTGTQHISILNAYMTKAYKKRRPLPPNHFIHDLSEHLPLSWHQQIERFAYYWIHRSTRSLRRELDLPMTNGFLDELLADEVWICDDPNLFPLDKTASNFRMIGPIDTQPVFPKPDEDFKENLIVVSLGSQRNLQNLSFLMNDHFRSFQILILGKGGKEITGDNILHRDWLDLDYVLPSARLFITHGGNGSAYKARKHNIPTLFYPTHLEQYWNAVAFEKAGVGRIASGWEAEEVIKFVLKSELLNAHSEKS